MREREHLLSHLSDLERDPGWRGWGTQGGTRGCSLDSADSAAQVLVSPGDELLLRHPAGTPASCPTLGLSWLP